MLNDNTGDAVKDLAQGVDKLIRQMRAEQKVVREWADEQAQQQHELATRAPADHRQGEAAGARGAQLDMALARARRGRYQANYWPGFVDMLSTLLLVVTFLMSLFMLSNFFVTQATSGKDTMLSRLNRQLAELTELLALERSKKESTEDESRRSPGYAWRQGERERSPHRIDSATPAARRKAPRKGQGARLGGSSISKRRSPTTRSPKSRC